MRLYYVRHAQSANNHLYDTTGSGKGRSEDPLLTPVGWRQVGVVAEFLQNMQNGNSGGAVPASDLQRVDHFHVTHVYSSLMIRAMATANAIAQAVRLPLVGRADIHEVGGMYLDDETNGSTISRPGQSRTFFQQEFPGCVLPDSVTEDGWWNRPFETPAERLPRAQRVWRDLLEKHGDSDDHIILVSHGAFFNYLLAAAVGLPDPAVSPYWFALNNASITRIDYRRGEVGVVYQNRLDHMPRDLLT